MEKYLDALKNNGVTNNEVKSEVEGTKHSYIRNFCPCFIYSPPKMFFPTLHSSPAISHQLFSSTIC